MKVVSGIARNVNSSSSVSGGGQHGNVSTSHVSMFRIQQQQVVLKFDDVVPIDEGDKILVAGDINKNILTGYAYRNYTTGVEGNENLFTVILFGLIFMIISIGIITFGAFDGQYLFFILALLPSIICVYFIIRFFKIQDAKSILRGMGKEDIQFN